MSLELIVGPLNSGRAGAVLDRFSACQARDPLLVVPNRDDVDRFERELCARPGGLLGGTVTSFPGLFRTVAGPYGVGGGAPLSRMQRVWLARAATDAVELRGLRRSAEHGGFAPALEALLGDLQATGLDAEGLAARVEELGEEAAYEMEIVALFAAYEQLRDELGRTDEHGLAAAATTALRADPGRWRGRPVLLYGFDDLAREQIELLAALASACEVTVALAYEDRPALAARAELLGVLTEELGGTVIAQLQPDRSHTDSSTLFHLERNLFEPEPGTAACEDGLTLLESAGERGEAELLGRRIAELIAGGSEPDEIAIAVRSPDRQAPLIARVLAGLGIPVAAEAKVPVAVTATGSTLLRLLAIAGHAPEAGSAADVVAFLRGPARAGQSSVDWLERRVLRDRLTTAAEALEAWSERHGREILPLRWLTEAADEPAALAGVIARIASDIAERPHMRAGPEPSGPAAVELRAAAEIRSAMAEVAELGARAPGPEQIPELLAHVRVPLWRGPTEGRVRILSPYRLRASRVSDLFVAGLTDGAFPSPGGGDPLLSDERRRGLGLPARRDPAAEERYLFYSCVSRPQRHLYLSYAGADESGATLARSPFVDEVRALLEPPPDPNPIDDELEMALTERSGVGEIAAAPELACSPRALARAVAALGPEAGGRRLAALELPESLREAAAASVAAARAGIEAASAPGPLRSPAVLEALAGNDLYGASTLETYDLCSYRWFVDHELDPQPIEPAPEPLETGGIIHEALENLYREAPEGPRPSPETLPVWIEAAREQLASAAAGRGWEPGSSRARIVLTRLGAVVERFLRRDAETGGPMTPDPRLLEAAFGAGPEDAFPPADLGSFRLHGKVDRIDVSSDGKALIRDYKLSAKVVAAAKLLQEGKLQLPLYIEAVKGMGLEPIGALYHPLAATKEREDRPRGMIVKDYKDVLVPGGTDDHVRTDFVEQAAFDELVAEGVARAREIVAAIGSGRVRRDPRDGKCPSWCGYAPICRMERGTIEPDPEEEEDAG